MRAAAKREERVAVGGFLEEPLGAEDVRLGIGLGIKKNCVTYLIP